MRRTRTGWVVLGAAVAAFLAAGGLAPAQERNADKTPSRGPVSYFGMSKCAFCHEMKDEKTDQLCRCTEMNIWKAADKHQVAFTVLKDDRARRMGDVLGYKVRERRECLTCHSNIDPEVVAKTPAALDISLRDPKDGKPKLDEGVSCVACHGASQKWILQHANLAPGEDGKLWRDRTAEEKDLKFGMTDLWNPDVRVKVCASCHVGNEAEGKVVTHEMYAAGHPPLPSFEVASFAFNEPIHWELLRQKAQKRPFLFSTEAAKHPNVVRYDRQRLEITSLVTVGSAAAFRESVKLLGDEAGRCAAAGNPNDKVLNLAQFDCAACHHDLQIPSWRQQRGYGAGKPGRPVARVWPTALVDLGIHHAGKTDSERAALHREFDAASRRLRETLDARPFGDAPRVRDAAKDLVAWSQRLADRLNDPKTRYSKQDANDLLKHLAAMPAAGTPDFDSARQIAWAFTAIYDELQAELADSTAAEDRALKEAYAKISGPMKPHVDALNANLRLRFRRNDGNDPSKPPPKDQLKVESFFPKVLERMSEYLVRKPTDTADPKVYGPADFQATFAAIRKLLP
jgi:Cytochrome c554 and c-prime